MCKRSMTARYKHYVHGYPPRACIFGDVESNPQNYDADGILKECHFLEPVTLPIYVGMKVALTRNVRPDIDYINGMTGTVVSYCSHT